VPGSAHVLMRNFSLQIEWHAHKAAVFAAAPDNTMLGGLWISIIKLAIKRALNILAGRRRAVLLLECVQCARANWKNKGARVCARARTFRASFMKIEEDWWIIGGDLENLSVLHPLLHPSYVFSGARDTLAIELKSFHPSSARLLRAANFLKPILYLLFY
jgi:hypothetical protein